MENGDNLETVRSKSVGNKIRCFWYDHFPRAGDAAGTAEIGQFSDALDGLEQCTGNSIGGLGIVAGDVCAEVSQMIDASRRPDEGHTRGAFRSRLRPHERSQLVTSWCETLRPSSSCLMPV